MTFDKVLGKVQELLEREKRVSYRGLKRRFDLDDEYLADLKEELIGAKRLATDEDGRFLVWAGGKTEVGSSQLSVVSSQPLTPNPQSPAERRQLTVMFCDLVGSTALSSQLDPEDLREIIGTYQHICAEVIQLYSGHIAQYLGDGLLVYFGYPVAHEDDAQRAVRTGLEIITALSQAVPSPLVGEGQGEGAKNRTKDTPHPHLLPQGEKELQKLHVRIGIHTGPVVIGEIGGGGRTEQLALGETPNIAARLQGLAEPDTVVVSAATYRLGQGLFESLDLGPQALKGISTPMMAYRVLSEGQARSRFEAAVNIGLTPLVGREEELGLLRRRWTQAHDGAGQVVLLSGEPGIGKSRLLQALKEQVSAEGATHIELRCSPYHQNSALYPIVDRLQRFLQFAREDTPEEKLKKLENTLKSRGGVTPPLQAERVPLIAALLSLPHPAGYPPITVSPQKQKEKTQAAIVAWLVEESETVPVYCVWEDLHWADPSTLEVLTLLLAQVPATRLLALVTFRPEFTPPWGSRSYLSQLTLNRLERPQVEAMVQQVAEGKALPAEVLEQIVAKTDGVPLFVEELTKTVMESVGAIHESPLQLTVPATLQDALMARLDRLGPTKEIAQLGATLGREFSYDLLYAVSPVAEENLQQGLRQLVEAELLYQRGLPPHATYLFKHALIQDTAYQSLLKSKRQQLHQQIAQVLAERFVETTETQPELLAHHYTEAGLVGQAIPYWQRAGERASQRSAYTEAIHHLTKALELLKTLPDTPERVQQELLLQVTLGTALMATQGYAAPDVGKAYVRARELCEQVSDFPLRVSVLWGLAAFYAVRGDLKTARELGEPLIGLAQKVQDPILRAAAAHSVGAISVLLGEFSRAHEYLEQGIRLYDARQHRSSITLFGEDLGVSCLCWGAFALFGLGYPEQARKRVQEALTLARALGHPTSLGYALSSAVHIYLDRREESATQTQAEALLDLAAEQGFALRMAQGSMGRGWTLAMQGQGKEGIAQLRQGLAAFQTSGAEFFRPFYLSLLAEACRQEGQIEEGLVVIAEALDVVEKNGERSYEAELYRLKGELLLAQARERL